MQRFGVSFPKKCCTKFFPLAQSIFPYFLCQATFFLPLHLFLHSLARMAVDPRNCPTLGLSTKKRRKKNHFRALQFIHLRRVISPPSFYGKSRGGCTPPLTQILACTSVLTYHRRGGVTECNNKLLEARRTYTWRTIHFVILFDPLYEPIFSRKKK